MTRRRILEDRPLFWVIVTAVGVGILILAVVGLLSLW